MSQTPMNVTEFSGSGEQLRELVAKYEGLVVVDFYATWCGPCKRLSGEVPKIAGMYPNVKFVKVDIDKNQSLAQEYGISAVPSLRFMKGSKGSASVVGQMSGFNPSGLKENINKLQ